MREAALRMPGVPAVNQPAGLGALGQAILLFLGAVVTAILSWHAALRSTRSQERQAPWGSVLQLGEKTLETLLTRVNELEENAQTLDATCQENRSKINGLEKEIDRLTIELMGAETRIAQLLEKNYELAQINENLQKVNARLQNDNINLTKTNEHQAKMINDLLQQGYAARDLLQDNRDEQERRDRQK